MRGIWSEHQLGCIPLTNQFEIDEQPVSLSVDVCQKSTIRVARLDIAFKRHSRTRGQEGLGEFAGFRSVAFDWPIPLDRFGCVHAE